MAIPQIGRDQNQRVNIVTDIKKLRSQEMAKKKIKEFKELQKIVPDLLEEYGDDQELLKAALANPILALNEVGIKLSREVEREVELRARFGKKEVKKLKDAESKVFKEAGTEFNLQSEDEVLEVVGAALKDSKVSSDKIEKAIRGNLQPVFYKQEKAMSPFSDISSDHKLMKLLDEYYSIERSKPRLANKKTFNKVKKGKDLPVTLKSVSFRLQKES